MRDHPIPAVTEPMQYRAIGIVRGIYRPQNSNQFTRGFLLDEGGEEIEAVVLGRVMTLMKRHLVMDRPHLWVVYPRCRQVDKLHLQIVGIWEPSTLEKSINLEPNSNFQQNISEVIKDELPEGDDYFSIRGELIFTRPETTDLVVKVRQKQRSDRTRSLPFKLQLKGSIPLQNLRSFVSLKMRRRGQELHLEDHEIIGPISTRGGRKHGGKKSTSQRVSG